MDAVIVCTAGISHNLFTCQRIKSCSSFDVLRLFCRVFELQSFKIIILFRTIIKNSLRWKYFASFRIQFVYFVIVYLPVTFYTLSVH